MRFAAAIERSGSFTDDDRATRGIVLRLYILGLQIELYLTAVK